MRFFRRDLRGRFLGEGKKTTTKKQPQVVQRKYNFNKYKNGRDTSTCCLGNLRYWDTSSRNLGSDTKCVSERDLFHILYPYIFIYLPPMSYKQLNYLYSNNNDERTLQCFSNSIRNIRSLIPTTKPPRYSSIRDPSTTVLWSRSRRVFRHLLSPFIYEYTLSTSTIAL